jgi:hypothetical protein
MKKEVRKGFLVSLGVVILLTIFPLSALACQYTGNGGCGGFWFGIESIYTGTYTWTARLYQVGDTLLETHTGQVVFHSDDLGKWFYVPATPVPDPADPNTWQAWDTTCNGSYYVRLSWKDSSGATLWSNRTADFSCTTPAAVTMASFTAAPTGKGIALDWTTASELDNLGFNIYRAKSADGPRTQLNASLILSQVPGSPLGAAYQFVDRKVRAGVTYYYWLEAVDVAGTSELYGPVSAAVQGTRRAMPVRPQLAPQPPLTGNK